MGDCCDQSVPSSSQEQPEESAKDEPSFENTHKSPITQITNSALSGLVSQCLSTKNNSRDTSHQQYCYPSTNSRPRLKKQLNMKISMLAKNDTLENKISKCVFDQLGNKESVRQHVVRRLTNVIQPQSCTKRYIIKSPRYGCLIQEENESNQEDLKDHNAEINNSQDRNSVDQIVPCSTWEHGRESENDSQEIFSINREAGSKCRERRYEKHMKLIVRELRSVIPSMYRMRNKRNILGSALEYIGELEQDIKGLCLQLGLDPEIPPQLLCPETLSVSTDTALGQTDSQSHLDATTSSETMEKVHPPLSLLLSPQKHDVDGKQKQDSQGSPEPSSWTTKLGSIPLQQTTPCSISQVSPGSISNSPHSAQDTLPEQKLQESPDRLSSVLLSSCQSMSPATKAQQNLNIVTALTKSYEGLTTNLLRTPSNVQSATTDLTQSPPLLPSMLYLDEGVAGASTCLSDYVIVLDEACAEGRDVNQGNTILQKAAENHSRLSESKTQAPTQEDILAKALQSLEASPQIDGIMSTGSIFSSLCYLGLSEEIVTTNENEGLSTQYTTPTSLALSSAVKATTHKKCKRKLKMDVTPTDGLKPTKTRPNNLKGFHQYYKSKRALFSRSHPDLSLQEVRHQVGLEWRSLQWSEKEKYWNAAQRQTTNATT